MLLYTIILKHIKEIRVLGYAKSAPKTSSAPRDILGRIALQRQTADAFLAQVCLITQNIPAMNATLCANQASSDMKLAPAFNAENLKTRNMVCLNNPIERCLNAVQGFIKHVLAVVYHGAHPAQTQYQPLLYMLEISHQNM
jgi:hypothetical protein